MLRSTCKAILAICVMLPVSSVWANTASFTFDQDACTGTCGLSPFATLTLVENGTGLDETVTVTETLRSGDRFAGTGAGKALEFDFSGTFILTNLTANFSLGSGGASASAFGSFTHFIECDTCHGGQAGNPGGPISFTIGSATGVTIADFTANSSGYLFASDIVGSNGKTGNVGVVETASQSPTNTADVLVTTPEPGTLAMLFGGLVLIGTGIKRRYKRD